MTNMKGDTMSEELVQQQIRINVALDAVELWRNNVGAMQAADGRVVRYGLMNDSAKLNERFKSSDLIGIKRTVVTPEMVGSVVGVFAAIECKAENWTAKITDPHTIAQRAFINLVTAAGGYAGFAQSVHDARRILRLG